MNLELEFYDRRGVYDLEGKSWVGGDLHEGGANSIYTGWTNAPIGMSLGLGLLGRSLGPRV